ncbi:hypothetical protein Tco_0320331 [Tanacetum coccineum]
MRTRSQTRNRNHQQQAQPAVVEPFHLEEPVVNPPLVPMADNRTMAQLLQAPTEGYEDAIVIPEINANFELKHGLINLVQNKQFFGHDKEDPHAHIHTFYNALNANDQDSLNSAAGGNFLDKMSRECLRIIESKSKVRNSRNKAVVAKVSSNLSTPGISPDVAALTTEVVERETEETTDKEQTNFQGSTAQIPPLIIPISISEPDVPKTLPKTTPILETDIPKNLPKPNIPYPSRRDDQKSRDKASTQMEKIFQIFQDLRFDISFADALLLMPRFAPTIKRLLMNKEKLLEFAKIPLNENCSAMLLKKLPE